MALACAVDVCRAAAYIDPALGETTLRELATDVAHEIKVGAQKFGFSCTNTDILTRVRCIIAAAVVLNSGTRTTISTWPCLPMLSQLFIAFYL